LEEGGDPGEVGVVGAHEQEAKAFAVELDIGVEAGVGEFGEDVIGGVEELTGY